MSANDPQLPKRRIWRDSTGDASETTKMPFLDDVVAEHPTTAPDPVISTHAGARRGRQRNG